MPAHRAPPSRPGASRGLLVRAELGQHLARFAVALRGSAQPMVRALEVAVFAQDDSEIALSRRVICPRGLLDSGGELCGANAYRFVMNVITSGYEARSDRLRRTAAS